MEIIEFVVGCLEILVQWRMALMIAIGVALAVLILFWLGTDAPGIILAVVVFLGCFLYGLYWQRQSERG